MKLKLKRNFFILFVAFLSLQSYANAQTALVEIQKDALRKCRDIYVTALNAYDKKDNAKCLSRLLEAANTVKDADLELYQALTDLRNTFEEKDLLVFGTAKQIAIIFNVRNEDLNLGYPMFNPGNPLYALPQMQGAATGQPNQEAK